MPVPAPATAKIIEGLPVYAGVHTGELTTPTGAALARSFVSNWQSLPFMKPAALGYGGGSRMIEGAANVVRVLVGERCVEDGSISSTDNALLEASGFMIEGCTLLETNIDHLSPEAMVFACEELLALGAMDVWQEPITMKKGRLAVKLSVLTSAAKAQEFAEAVVRLTGSLGVRRSYVERTVVPRKVELKETVYGEVHYKTAAVNTPNGSIKLNRPEYEDVARIAREQGLDFNQLYEDVRNLKDL